MNERENAAFVWMLRTINKLNVKNYELEKEIEELKKQNNSLVQIAVGWHSEVEYLKKMNYER